LVALLFRAKLAEIITDGCELDVISSGEDGNDICYGGRAKASEDVIEPVAMKR
jgi:hypothetical protein